MKHAHLNKQTNEILGWYDTKIHKNIPTPNLKIGEKVYQEAININANFYDIKTKKFEVKDFRTDKEKEEEITLQKKAKKVEQLNTLVVTTSQGNTFDGNETARLNMVSAIQSAELLGQISNNWKLADNTVKEISLNELKEALALSIQKVGEIVTA